MNKSLAFLALAISLSPANERKFSYVYETATMPSGQVEVEAWNTLRYGKDQFYSALDHRLEVEWGMGKRLQGALYLNAQSVIQPTLDQAGNLASNGKYAELSETSKLKGFSFELKHQLLNPALDPIGFAYYTELGVQANELELEGKLLFDKNMGKWTTALNLEGEVELEAEAELESSTETKTEVEAEAFKWAADLGIAYAISPRQSIGLESRLHSHIEGENQETALYAGPNFAFAGERFWGTLTVLPQLGSKTKEHELFETRLLMGFHF